MKKSLVILLILVGFGISLHAQPTDYFSYWPLNGNTNDIGSNNFHGTNHGASLTADRFGNHNTAYSFDGVNDYIDLGSLGSFGSQMDSFTMSIWLKTDEDQLCTILKTINNSTNTMLGIDLNRNNTYAYEEGYTLFDLRGEGFKRLSGHITANLYENSWHLLVVRVVDASNNNFEVYVDGNQVPVDINYTMSPTYANFQYPLVIGAANVRGTIQDYYNGSLDDFRLYTRALNSLEISDLYDIGSGGGSSVWSSSGANIFYNSGNVGLGTNDFSYKLSVNGTIRAKEIKVETGWADFVFDEDYQLRSPLEVESFIQENGHLPDIPSAKEVEENGVNIGQIESKLLQKIEELTLYMIEQNKRIEKLEKENKKLKNELNEIKNVVSNEQN